MDKPNKKIQFDVSMAHSFLKSLDPFAEKFMFLTFPDQKKTKGAGGARTFYGSLSQLESNLVSLNKQGMGIFVTISEIANDSSNGRPSRKKENVTRIRAIFADDDMPRSEYRAEWPIEPSLIVESSKGKFHYYWVCREELELSRFRPIQKSIAANFGTDSAVCDLPRVMRLPGFLHNKAEPFLTRIIKVNDRAYSNAEIVHAFPPEDSRKVKASPRLPLADGGVIGHGPCADIVADLSYEQIKPFLEELKGQKDIRTSPISCGVRNSSNEGSCLISMGEDGFIIITDFGDENGPTTHIMNGDAKFDFVSKKVESLNKSSPPKEIFKTLSLTSKMSPLEKEDILQKIAKGTGTSITALRQQIQANNKIDSLGKSSPAIADAVVEKIGNENVIYIDNDSFYIWNEPVSGIWNQASDRALKVQIDAACRSVLKTKYDSQMVNSVLDLVKTKCYAADRQLNKNSDEIINVPNGQLRYEAGDWILEPHDKFRYATQCLPIEYSPEAKAENFLIFLDEIFRDDEDSTDKQTLILEIIGYAMLPSCRFEKFALFTGTGANGKSVLLDIIESLLGRENVCNIGGHLLGNNFNIAHISGKLANIVTEMPTNKALADAPIKSLVSGELTTAAHKGKNAFEFKPVAMMIFAANHLPHVLDHSDALFRRVLLVRFNRTFDEKKGEQDKDLKNKLKKYLPGIMNLALAAIGDVIERGHFTASASVDSDVNKWRRNVNQAARFIDDCCVALDGEKVLFDSLYSDFREWAKEQDVGGRLTKQNFSQRLTELGYKTVKSNGKRFKLGLKMNMPM